MKNILLFAGLCLALQGLSAQDTLRKSLPRWTLAFAAAQQDYVFEIDAGDLPVLQRPLRPAFTLGLERNYLKGSRHRLYQSLIATWYYNPYAERSLTIATELGYDFKIWKGIYLGPRISGGYQRGNRNDVVYRLENGQWLPERWSGPGDITHRFQLQTGIDVGYRFGKIDAFAGVNASSVSPYSVVGQIPLFLFRSVRVGVKVNGIFGS